MVIVEYSSEFKKTVKKFKQDIAQIKKQTAKIIADPTIGKPMRYSLKGSRELYVGSFRINYKYYPSDDKIFFVKVYHKDEQ